MSADRIREAAKVLREKAEATSWVPQCGGWWRPDDQPRRRLPAKVAEADTNVAECHYAPNADYIATMHPGVGLALADWLDDLADHDASDLTPMERGAFAVADLILGTPVCRHERTTVVEDGPGLAGGFLIHVCDDCGQDVEVVR